MTTIRRRDFEELDFTVVATERNEAVYRFEVYEIVGREHIDGKKGEASKAPLYWRKDWQGSGDWTTDLGEAALYATGDIKWDGCSNWLFNHEEAGWYHYCDRKGIQSLGRVMEACWLWASELIANWDGEDDQQQS